MIGSFQSEFFLPFKMIVPKSSVLNPIETPGLQVLDYVMMKMWMSNAVVFCNNHNDQGKGG